MSSCALFTSRWCARENKAEDTLLFSYRRKKRRTMELDNTYVRTQEEVNEAIKLANIEDTKLKITSQVLLPTPKVDDGCYKLMELDDHLFKELTEGSCLSFRGPKNVCAVVCTKNHTYEIKEAETSNTLLLVRNLKLGNDINGICQDPEDRIIHEAISEGEYRTYYELKECKPKLGELLSLLGPSSFKGLEYEKDLDPDSLYTWDKLCENIQASECELREALSNHLIANINGHYRLVSFEYEARALTFMLDLMDENSWEVDEIDKEATYEALKELIPREVFELVFHKYTELSDKSTPDGALLYRYNEEKTCKFLAEILLAASPVNDYRQFMEAWKIGAPEKLRPKEKYLSGIALITWNNQKMRKEVISYPESNLSENIVKRLNELFKVKSKWTVDEITPYISRCTTRTTDVNALLTKYARPTTVNGVKYYCSKHGK